MLSFPANVEAKRALVVAEAWAAEMFQSGEHVQDEWAYVAALHTDRAHPHVHIVVNNRGIENGTWFYMAKGHAFDLDMMKGRMVELAAEQGLYLDHSSRVDRGILTYGPSRVELERALREGGEVEERPLTGRALRDAMEQIGSNVRTLRTLASLVSDPSDSELSQKFTQAAATLESGGILTSIQEKNMEAQSIQNRGQLIEFFDKWMDAAERDIDRLQGPDRAEMRKELFQVAAEVAADLGDKRAAQYMQMPARETLYSTKLTDGAVSNDRVTRQLAPDAANEIQDQLAKAGRAIGLDPAEMKTRLAQGADNAWQEREWIKRDISAVATANKLDLDREGDRSKTAELLDSFYKSSGQTLSNALQRQQENDRVTRTLGAMVESNARSGEVMFRNNEDAGRFATDLRARYGEDVIARIAQGDDRALAVDYADAQQRRAIAQAVVAAAEQHPTMGLTLREVEAAKENLAETSREKTKENERHHSRDRDSDREL